MLIDVCALDLRHRYEVIRQLVSIVSSHPSYLGQTLIAIEEELFSEILQLLTLPRQHIPVSFLLAVQKLVLPPYQVILWPLEPPPRQILRLEEPHFAIYKTALFLDEVLFHSFSDCVQLSK